MPESDALTGARRIVPDGGRARRRGLSDSVRPQNSSGGGVDIHGLIREYDGVGAAFHRTEFASADSGAVMVFRSKVDGVIAVIVGDFAVPGGGGAPEDFAARAPRGNRCPDQCRINIPRKLVHPVPGEITAERVVPWNDIFFVVNGIASNGKAGLLKIVDTAAFLRHFPGPVESRQKQCRQNGDYSNNYQQFNKRELFSHGDLSCLDFVHYLLIFEDRHIEKLAGTYLQISFGSTVADTICRGGIPLFFPRRIPGDEACLNDGIARSALFRRQLLLQQVECGDSLLPGIAVDAGKRRG